ncbi:hypothetical protein STEG23_001805, partial [Scotinomys teguina]
MLNKVLLVEQEVKDPRKRSGILARNRQPCVLLVEVGPSPSYLWNPSSFNLTDFPRDCCNHRQPDFLLERARVGFRTVVTRNAVPLGSQKTHRVNTIDPAAIPSGPGVESRHIVKLKFGVVIQLSAASN